MNLDRQRASTDADAETGTYRGAYPARPPSVAVTHALAGVTDGDTTDLGSTYEAASAKADAFDDQFGTSTGGRDHDDRVISTDRDYTITARSRGRIVRRSPTASANPPTECR